MTEEREDFLVTTGETVVVMNLTMGGKTKRGNQGGMRRETSWSGPPVHEKAMETPRTRSAQLTDSTRCIPAVSMRIESLLGKAQETRFVSEATQSRPLLHQGREAPRGIC